MRNILTMAGKEIRSAFSSPVAYVVLTGFLLLGGWFFFNLLARFNYVYAIYSAQAAHNPQLMSRLNLNELVMAPLLHNLSVILLFLIPLITMRSFAEEKKAGTYELLLTSPLRVSEIVIGKFAGSFVFLLVMLGLACLYPIILVSYGNPETGVIIAGYIGIALVGVTFLAIGLFASSVTENQIIAAVVGIVINLFLYVISWPAETAGGTLGKLLSYLSLTEHFSQLVKGIVDTKDLAYFGSAIFLALFLTHRSVESIRWR